MAFVPKNNKWLGYTLYVVFVTLLLLYYLFPDQAVVNLVDSGISRINPEYERILFLFRPIQQSFRFFCLPFYYITQDVRE